MQRTGLTVLNAGAYTAVDKAESEPQLAWAVRWSTSGFC